jgi:hypothetical protein
MTKQTGDFRDYANAPKTISKHFDLDGVRSQLINHLLPTLVTWFFYIQRLNLISFFSPSFKNSELHIPNWSLDISHNTTKTLTNLYNRSPRQWNFLWSYMSCQHPRLKTATSVHWNHFQTLMVTANFPLRYDLRMYLLVTSTFLSLIISKSVSYLCPIVTSYGVVTLQLR